MRRTKIVATLGPSTDYRNNLKKIIKLGVNVLRLNFSHGTPEDHIRRANNVHLIAKKLNMHVALLGDLQGPKIRISKFKKNKILLQKGNIFTLDADLNIYAGDERSVGIDYKMLPQDLFPGDILLLDDGRVRLKVIKIIFSKIITMVTVGGFLSDNKGINKLGGGLSAKSITKKDYRDIKLAAGIGVDYLAVSFPRCCDDIKLARSLINKLGSNAKIVAKIERAEAVFNEKNMKEIILSSDAIMVARGDLGVEIGDPELVGIQKKLIRTARRMNRVVITATQMMESMINLPSPTRAEVMDVANAVLDGSDAVMLSAETASGKYPVETVKAMSKVCIGAEKVPSINVSRHRLDIKFTDIEESIAMAAMYSANHLKGVSAIITLTESGNTPLMTSRITSGLPIFALSRHQKTLNLASLYRGVTPIFFDSYKNSNEISSEAIKLLLQKGYLTPGEIVIFTNGEIMSQTGKTDTIRILKVY